MIAARRAALLGASLAVTASGVAPALRRRRRRRGEARVFILEYHDVSAAGAAEGVIPAARLRRQLHHLKRHYRFAALTQAASLRARPGALREDLVVVTFDDGYAGNFEAAWPVLREEGVPAAIFVTTGFLDGGELWFDFARRALAAARRAGPGLGARPRRALAEAFGSWPAGGGRPVGGDRSLGKAVERLKLVEPAARQRLLDELRAADLALDPPARPLTWEQVRALAAAGIEIGCHTVSHPILGQLPPRRQAEEIAGARERIRQETGAAPALFAYPNGGAADFTAATRELVRAAGFSAACTTVRGANRPGCDPLRLRRIGLGDDPGFVLVARLSGMFDEEPRRRSQPRPQEQTA